MPFLESSEHRRVPPGMGGLTQDFMRQLSLLLASPEAERILTKGRPFADAAGTSYKSYIGANLRSGRVTAVKAYFTYYAPLSRSDIERLTPEDASEFLEYYKDLHKIDDIQAGGSGVTFAVKRGSDGCLACGIYYRVISEEVAGAFENLPEYSSLRAVAPSAIGRTGVYFARVGNQRKVETRYLYYFDDPRTIKVIGGLLGWDRAEAPSVEYCVGRTESSYRKCNLLGDYSRVLARVTSEPGWRAVTSLLAFSRSTLGLTGFCPGRYADRSCVSIYLLDLRGFEATGKIRTVEGLYSGDLSRNCAEWTRDSHG